MKTLRKIIFLFITILVIMLIVSCNNDSNNKHTNHNYSIQKSDETKHWKECECGEKSEENVHTFSKWETIKEPTEENTGTKERECDVCHYKETSTIDKLTHQHNYPTTFNKWDETKHWKECSCGEKSEENEHTFGNWETIKEPTEENTGTKERECSVCHYKETDIIDKLEHQHNYPTTFNKWDENNHWKECECGEKSEESIHTFGNWKTIKEPTEVSTGTKERECSVCHYKETKILTITQGLSFELNSDNQSYYVSGIGTATETDIIIPSTYNNLPVTRIGSYAFWECRDLTSIVIANGITTIEEGAFGSCSSILSIIIPNSVTSIETGALFECSSLTNIVIPEGVTELKEAVFAGCSSLKSITIPQGVTSIGIIAFSHCTSLESVEIPEGVTEISGQAFSHCTSLESVEIPEGVKEISEGAFENCNKLTKINIPDSVIYLETTTFDGCSNLHYNEYNDCLYLGNEKNPYFWFINPKNAAITSCQINDNTKHIAMYSFSHCSSLTSITIPAGIIDLDFWGFYLCESLSSIYYEGSIEDWCKLDTQKIFSANTTNHFYLRNSNNEWEEVTSIEIPEGVTEIGKNQFYGFNNVTSITIPNSVTSIGRFAFYECYKLTEVYNLSKLNIKVGSYDIGDVGYYAKVIHTSLEEASRLIEKDNYVFYKDDNNKFYLVSYKGTDKELVLPNDIEGNTYEINDYAFYGCSSLTSIVIPNSVTSIGISAFYGCVSLTSVVIPNSVTSIEGAAFLNCYRLVDVYNLSNLNITAESDDNGRVGYYAKVIHTSLEEPSILIEKDNYEFIKDNNNKYYLISYKGTDEKLVLPKDVEGNDYVINKGAFSSCNSLTSIVIPSSVTSIGEYAFNGCVSLTSITIPNSVTSIGDYTFRNCCNLTSIVIPSSVTSIGNYAFSDCSSLTSIVIPNSVTSIGEAAFNGCISLKFNEYDNALYLGNSENPYLWLINVKDSSMTSCEINNSTKFIHSSAFSSCSSLTSVTIGNSVTSIGNGAFSYCRSLTSITIPNSVTSIGERAFSSCSNLTSVTIGNGVTSIGNDAFSYCSSLTSITIPNSVTSIGLDAFNNCSSLQYKEYDNGLYLGNSENPYLILIKAKDKTITSCEMNTQTKFIYQYAFSSCSSLTSVTIGNSVTSIGYGAFYECSSLTSITIPNSVTSIGERAFENCSSLTSITIPNSVTSIGNYAFSDCSSLTSITIPNSVTSIGSSAFSYCRSLTSITIPNSVTSIGSSAFYGCISLTNMVISNSVKNIGNWAFSYCSNLKEVYYTGSSTDWNSINIDSSNSELTSAIIYYYAETEPTTLGNYWHYVDDIPTKW